MKKDLDLIVTFDRDDGADNWAFFNELEDCHGDLVRFHGQHSEFYDDGDAGLVEQLVHEVEDCGGLVQIGKTYFELAFLEDQEGYRAVSISELQEGKALKPTTFALARIPNTYADSFKSAMTECIQYINAYLNDDVWYWRVDRSDGAELDHDYGYIGRPAAIAGFMECHDISRYRVFVSATEMTEMIQDQVEVNARMIKSMNKAFHVQKARGR